MRKRAKRPGTTLVRIKTEKLEELRRLKAKTGVPMRELAERAISEFLARPGA